MSPRPFVAGLFAAACAAVAAFALRLATGARSPFELLADRVTALVPLSLFSLLLSIFERAAKPLLLAGVVLGFLLLGGFLGVAHGRRRWPGPLLGVALWVLGLLCLLPDILSSPGELPTIAGSLALPAAIYTAALLAILRARSALPATEAPVGRRFGRRDLLIRGGAAIVLAAAGFSLWRFVLSRAAPAPAAASGLTPEITPTGDFYVVSKNVFDPNVDRGAWRLSVGGLVERPFELTYEQLVVLPIKTQYHTLECISNEVGGDLIGNALWKGIPLKDLLGQAGLKPGVQRIALFAADDYSDSITVEKALAEGTLVATEMNGAELSPEHGFPARLLVPDIYGMKNVKWITRVEAVAGDFEGYWQERGWSNVATIKTMSRIDAPKPGSAVTREPLTVGGIAFAGARGVRRVEVSFDDGRTWREAALRPALGANTWQLWTLDWTPPPDGPEIVRFRVRAADGRGELQTEMPTEPLPDGASGYHVLAVRLADR